MQFASGVHDLMGDEGIRLIVELSFWNYITPLEAVNLVERHHHDVFCMVAGGLAAPPVPWHAV